MKKTRTTMTETSEPEADADLDLDLDPGMADFLKAVPSAKDKLLVDMVNCLHVSADQIEVQIRQENGFFSRWLDSVSGAEGRRSHRVAKNHNVALQNMTQVINALSGSLTRSNQAITQVSERVTALEHALAGTVHALVEVRESLAAMTRHLKKDLDRIDDRLDHMDLRSAAGEELDWVLSRWEAGVFHQVPVASRCYLALHELHSGVFGEYVRRHAGEERVAKVFETGMLRVVARLNADLGVKAGERVSMRGGWLARPADAARDAEGAFREGLAYLGTDADADRSPMVSMCARGPVEVDAWPKRVPLVCDAQRVVNALAQEMFQAGRQEGGV